MRTHRIAAWAVGICILVVVLATTVVLIQARQGGTYRVTVTIMGACHRASPVQVAGHRWQPDAPAPSEWSGSIDGTFHVRSAAQTATFVALSGGSEHFVRIPGREAPSLLC